MEIKTKQEIENKIIKRMENIGYIVEKSVNPYNNKIIIWFRHYHNYISLNELKKIIKYFNEINE